MGAFDHIVGPAERAQGAAAAHEEARERGVVRLASALAEASPQLDLVLMDFVVKAKEFRLASDLDSPRRELSQQRDEYVTRVSIDGVRTPQQPLGWSCAWTQAKTESDDYYALCVAWVLLDGRVVYRSQRQQRREPWLFGHATHITGIDYATESSPYPRLWSALLSDSGIYAYRASQRKLAFDDVPGALARFKAGLANRLQGSQPAPNCGSTVAAPEVVQAFRGATGG